MKWELTKAMFRLVVVLTIVVPVVSKLYWEGGL